MSTVAARRRPRSFLPVWSDLWSDLWTGFPSVTGLRPKIDTHLIRLEDDMTDGHYLLRAELPGIDPDKDVEITVRDGRLTIKAERTEKKERKGRSEFSYGSFVRTVTLPPGASEDDIKATYDKGILTVDVAVPEQAALEENAYRCKPRAEPVSQRPRSQDQRLRGRAITYGKAPMGRREHRVEHW